MYVAIFEKNVNIQYDPTRPLNFLCIRLKNGQTYYENLAIFLPQNFLKYSWPFLTLCMNRLIIVAISFLGGAPTSLCHPFHMPIHPPICPSIHRAPYLRDRISSDHNFWYTYVKWWYLQVFFFNFDFLGC